MTVTKQNARRATARRLGGHEIFAVAAATISSVTVANFVSSLLDADHLDQVWALFPEVGAPRQRRVAAGGLNSATGEITLEAPLGSVPQVGSAVELHTVLPGAGGTAASMSVDVAVQAATQALLVPRTVELALVSGRYDYDGLPDWLSRPERLLRVLVPNALGSASLEIPSDRWELQGGSGARRLHFHRPFTFKHGALRVTLEAVSPAERLVNGVESSVGLLAQTDTVAVEERDLAEVALVWCYGALAQGEDAARSSHYARLLGPQIAVARSTYGYDRVADPAAAFAALVPPSRAARSAPAAAAAESEAAT